MKILIKILNITIVFILLCSSLVFADIEDEEIIEVLELNKEVIEASADMYDEPIINSRSAVIFDRNSKKALYNKNMNSRRPMASTTKIMTAIVVLENSNLKDVVKVSKKAAGTGGSSLKLKTNDEVSVENLLYGLMLVSGNDAAVALAEHIAESVEGFARLMNAKAEELKLENTHFVTPHGLDEEEHYTTAYELAILADYALKIPKFAEIVGTKTYTVKINNTPKIISNTNELLGNISGVYGVKTGFTNGANRCLVSSAKRRDLDIICVVLGADTKKDRTRDSIKLIEYSFQNFEVFNIKEKLEEDFNSWKNINEKRIVVNKGVRSNPKLELEKLPYEKIAIKKGEENNIRIQIENGNNFEAPLEEKTKIGFIKCYINETEQFEVQILNKELIEKKNVLDYFIELLQKYNFCSKLN
ncbi:MAG: D-alanyl-D-alanine carboxypeptidase [Clostridia bacterium]|nr:D-alanyl-D-alanine carboxypeptidase [Clostridia bacterium]